VWKDDEQKESRREKVERAIEGSITKRETKWVTGWRKERAEKGERGNEREKCGEEFWKFQEMENVNEECWCQKERMEMEIDL